MRKSRVERSPGGDKRETEGDGEGGHNRTHEQNDLKIKSKSIYSDNRLLLISIAVSLLHVTVKDNVKNCTNQLNTWNMMNWG